MVIGIALLLMAQRGVGSDEIDYSKKKELLAREYLELTGQLTRMVIKADAMIAENMKSLPENSNPALIKEFATRLKNEVSENTFASIIAPIFARHFSELELQELIEFYKTKTGRKMIRISFMLSREMKLEVDEWGRRISRRIVEDMLKKNPRLMPGKVE